MRASGTRKAVGSARVERHAPPADSFQAAVHAEQMVRAARQSRSVRMPGTAGTICQLAPAWSARQNRFARPGGTNHVSSQPAVRRATASQAGVEGYICVMSRLRDSSAFGSVPNGAALHRARKKWFRTDRRAALLPMISPAISSGPYRTTHQARQTMKCQIANGSECSAVDVQT